MRLLELTQASKEWIESCASLLDGTTCPSDSRSRLCGALLHLSIEHHRSIHVLMEFQFFGSALALYRPQLEAYLRGTWLRYCATDSQVAEFISGRDPPSPGHMAQALDGVPTFLGTDLGGYKRKFWARLCDFTHGGIAQAARRVADDEIRSNYSDDLLSSVLTSASVLSWLAATGLADLSGDPVLVDKVGHAFKLRSQEAA